MRKGYHSYLIITSMFTGSFDIKQSDFPRKNDRKTEDVVFFSHKLKNNHLFNGFCDVRNDKSTIKQ